MTGATLDLPRGQHLRTAAVGGAAFTILYVVHRILQGLGPAGDTVAAIAAYHAEHRASLLASEVAVGAALLAFIPFLAALVLVIWQAGEQASALATGIGGAVFLAMGFVSQAAETALVAVADSDEPGAVLALQQLQARIPNVWVTAALVATIGVAVMRTAVLPRWVGIFGLIVAPVFLLGGIFSVLGRTAEGSGSLVGIGIFIAWMLALSASLWRAGGKLPTPAPTR